ncbi:MAG: Flp pilus assembly protein TadB [uncultured Sphingomonadaceae bacterium]|uniref:Flp pilus assembly protein TadB n=1 Tax=uncultured Sphingomonadaceae bacterium TaxID=169976 RepID=A0A6J4SA56_9SPHN|nr:MAG: Flp pilus assembly protein TadB [uncultured Sphingomonadaceae bacterium]
MSALPLIALSFGMLLTLWTVYLAYAGPNKAKAANRRLEALKERHSQSSAVATQAQMKRVMAQRMSKLDGVATRFLPNPQRLAKRIEQTGRNWSLSRYVGASALLALVVMAAAYLKTGSVMFAIAIGLFVGLGFPHWLIGVLIKRRANSFTKRFPDAIELMVRGLRSGLPITETLGIVAAEIPGPVGIEFRQVSDKMKIGRTMEAALQETADRLGTPEFQFFTITLAIQRETGGNLAETLSNLADVLRKRSQMKLKIKAMSSESKASAYIIGALPFIVFGLISFISPDYMAGFFVEPRLIVAGIGGMIWMSIGAFIMAKMVNFEI